MKFTSDTFIAIRTIPQEFNAFMGFRFSASRNVHEPLFEPASYPTVTILVLYACCPVGWLDKC